MELLGYTECPSTFEKYLNVDKSVPTTTDQLTSFDSSSPSLEHVVGDEEEKMEETQHLPTLSLCRNPLML